ncbi:hypothetical protein ALC57_03856 [Trachymyrmex cornetzi]|uniref:Uncharacterized protein n=1 Tax=Trachymyrmex cornetzi TaxID=471704 RepID=A0A195EEW5_9HYME|nr:hypothetical protein ALC57_03856 [Trachymyrmex cornetzi]
MKKIIVAMKRTWSIEERLFKDDFRRKILAEETKIREIKTEAIRRAIKYKEKIRNTKKKLIQECIKDLEKERTLKEEDN